MLSSSSVSMMRRLPHNFGATNIGPLTRTKMVPPPQQCRCFASDEPINDDPETNVIKTALYELHKALGGEFVPFAGHALPIMYKGEPETTGILKEHLWCRTPGKASLFDVSHMGQVSVSSFQIL
jgi:Aminomethyltransferase folate-binding domain